MLDIGFSELLVFGIIALLVLGPEKLPEAARSTAKGYGKFKRLIGTIQNEIDQQLNLSELRQEMQAEINRISELEQRMTQQFASLQRNLSSSVIALEPPQTKRYAWVQRDLFNAPYTLAYQQRTLLPLLRSTVSAATIASMESPIPQQQKEVPALKIAV